MRYAETRDVPLAELSRFPGNARRGDVAAIRASIRRHGQYRAIVVRDTGAGLVILAGNHTRDALDAEGHASARCEVIECTDDEARRINLADNRLAELGGYDDADLAALLASLDGDFTGTGWAQGDLDALLKQEPESRTDPDDVPETPAEPVTQPGDLWLLGPHRLLCGDAQTPEALDRLLDGGRPGVILTDPPYGMNLDTDYTVRPRGSDRGLLKDRPAKTYRPVIGDDEPFDAGFLAAYFADVAEQFWFGADYYRRTLSEQDTDGSWLVWDKRGEGADNGIGSGFELIWSKQKHKRDLLRHFWYGAFGAEASNRVHPTQKPTKLLAEILERWTKQGAVAADLFGGSGSTLIAAHATSRIARVMELDPGYCDVICQRYQDHTGTAPVLADTHARVSA